MDALTVELLPQRSAEGFAARYDACGLLTLETRNTHHWPHGATLDGFLTLDLDEEHVLVHVELAWPRERWPTESDSA
jgi:hypothetical protein